MHFAPQLFICSMSFWFSLCQISKYFLGIVNSPFFFPKRWEQKDTRYAFKLSQHAIYPNTWTLAYESVVSGWSKESTAHRLNKPGECNCAVVSVMNPYQQTAISTNSLGARLCMF